MLDARPVEVRARLAAQVEDVLEALVRDERRSRSPPLEEGVRRDRRPVREALDVGSADGSRCATTDSSWRAAVGTFAIRTSPVLDEDRVRERPADVDPQARASAGFWMIHRGRVCARAPSRLPRAQPSHRSRRVARAHRRARARRRALPSRSRARGAADLLPRRALRAADVGSRGRARRARRRALDRARVSRELLLDHLYVHAARTSPAICAASPPASTRSCSARRRSSGRSARRSIRYGAQGRSGRGSRCSSARRSPPGAALAPRPRSARIRRPRARWRSRSPRGRWAISERSLLVVGAGRIGLQTLKAAEGRGIARIAVANRTKARAVEVSERFGASGHDLGELETALAEADVAITATSSEAPVVERGRRPRRDGRRAGSSAGPRRSRGSRGRRARGGDIEGVRLFDVDDLRAGLDDAMAARLREVPKVEAVVEEEVDDFGRRYRELEVEPLLSELRKQAESIRARELERRSTTSATSTQPSPSGWSTSRERS